MKHRVYIEDFKADRDINNNFKHRLVATFNSKSDAEHYIYLSNWNAIRGNDFAGNPINGGGIENCPGTTYLGMEAK